ncbi:MAG TPA: hypothetical protein VF257_09650 [Solirubrobacteraceae bacterium]
MTQPLVVLAPLRGGEADAARGAIAALHEPFARVPGTHMARLQVLRPRARRFRGRTRHYVLLVAEHDGAAAPWLAAAARELDAVLSHCAFWPGPDDPAEVVSWAQARELRVGFSIAGSPGATVEEVGEALALRERLGRFAAHSEGLDDAALHAAWEAR